MQTLCSQIEIPAEWAVFHDMSRMLRLAGFVSAPEQAACGINAFGYRTAYRESWPGQRVGVRPPEAGETPLSAAEVPYLALGVGEQGVSL
jgi:hypothetical protein